MGQDSLANDESVSNTYEPLVQTVKKSQKECEDFWGRLVSESEEADAALLAGRPCIQEVAASCDDDRTLAEDPSLPFEEKYDRLIGIVSNKPTHREILIRTLGFCQEQRSFSLVEETIQSYPEFPAAGQNPYRLITYLVEGEGLDLLEVGADGGVITPEMKAGLTEDEVDDLIHAYHLQTTELGEKLVKELSPERRISDLFSRFADRRQHYSELLAYCKEPRKFKDIEKLFAGRDLAGLETLHPESGLAIKPTVFVDNMEKAGALVWKREGWVLTREGEMYLETLARGSMK